MSYANKKRLEKLEGEDARRGVVYEILDYPPDDEEAKAMSGRIMTEEEWEAYCCSPERRP